MGSRSSLALRGLLTARIELPPGQEDAAVLRGCDVERAGSGLLVARRRNAFVNMGLQAALDRMFGLSTTAAISHMGITDDAQTVVAGTTLLNPAGGGSNASIKALGSGVGAVATSRAAQTVSASAGWTKADANFIVTKVGLLNAATDAGDADPSPISGVWNIIGGTGGASPYNEPFTIDLTGTTAFNLTLFIDVTATAT